MNVKCISLGFVNGWDILRLSFRTNYYCQLCYCWEIPLVTSFSQQPSQTNTALHQWCPVKVFPHYLLIDAVSSSQFHCKLVHTEITSDIHNRCHQKPRMETFHFLAKEQCLKWWFQVTIDWEYFYLALIEWCKWKRTLRHRSTRLDAASATGQEIQYEIDLLKILLIVISGMRLMGMIIMVTWMHIILFDCLLWQ
jgi:hypothetical protein